MIQEQLTELGFYNLPKTHDTDIAYKMRDQIDSDPTIAENVQDEISDWNAPYPVDKENYDRVLERWIEETAYELYLELN